MTAYDTALEAIGGLSDPSKMPCYSYSLPATRCMLGSKLRPIAGSACSKCYALKGCYVFPSTRDAMARRMAIVDAMLGDNAKLVEWVESFALVLNTLRDRTDRLIARKGRPGARDGRFFRWHDSGDLQSVAHLRAIGSVAAATPTVAHWIPTREAGIVKAYIDAVGWVLPNLRIRVSAPYIDRPAAPALLALAEHEGVELSGIHSHGAAPAIGSTCVAYRQEGACRDCRACWRPGGVSYPLH